MQAALPKHESSVLTLGEWQLRVQPQKGLGVVIEGVIGAPEDYVNEALLMGATRALFLSLIDTEGLVVCRNVGGDDRFHKHVRGRSSKGRPSQGEFYHHDGCAGPVKPRVVEIRLPYQETPRHIATAVAPFSDVITAMLLALPRAMSQEPAIVAHYERAKFGAPVAPDQRHALQGTINRMLRRRLSAEDTRAYFREVDVAAGAYREPWQMGESRFIANSNEGRTMQHRRAYMKPHTDHESNGALMKRWPDGPEDSHGSCAIVG